MRIAAWVLWLVACGSTVEPPPALPPLRPPAPPALVAVDPPPPTLRLPRHFTPVSYAVNLAVDPAKPTFSGLIRITGQLAQPTHVIWLHAQNLTIKAATARGSRSVTLAANQRGDDLLELRAEAPLEPGGYEIAISYVGQVSTNNQAGAFLSPYRGANFVFTQMEPVSARKVFPCFDEPDRKVPWQLALDIPLGMQAVSNTPVVREASGSVTKHVEFAATRPLPSYLIMFGVGPLAFVDAGTSRSGIPIRIVVPIGTEDRAAHAAKVTPRLVDVIESWFGMTYPYPKLDIVVSPTYGDAMEDAGAILTGPDMLIDRSDGWVAKRGVVHTIGHEIAHQWFGDLVTPAWWDDIWLNESFATWMEDAILASFEPAWGDEDVYLSVRNGALEADGLTVARRIREPIRDTGGIFNAFDGITYQKGASVLRMIERQIGNETFRTGVRAFMKAHADGVATSADLVKELETASGKPLAGVLSSFLDQAGAPVLTMKLACGDKPGILVEQNRFVPLGAPAGAAQTWTLPVCVAHDGKRTCAMLDQHTGTIPLPSCPTWWTGNAGGDGYYRIAVTAADVAASTKSVVWKALSNRERRALLEDARAQVMIGKLPVASLMAIAKLLLGSDDPLSVADALGGTGRFGLLAMTGLPKDVVGAVPADLAEPVRKRLLADVGPRAVALGFAGKPDDDYRREVLHAAFVRSAVRLKEPRLGRDAVALARDYRALPSGIRALVLRLAVAASPALADELLAAVLAEPDAGRRHEMLRALAANPDPVRRTRALDLALDPKFEPGDDLGDLMFAFDDESERAPIEQWLRAHWTALQGRLPSRSNRSIVPFLGWVFASACDPARRDELASYVRANFAVYLGGDSVADQEVESMDQCIAQRAAVGPSIKAWLSP